jgi:hypothetical protein
VRQITTLNDLPRRRSEQRFGEAITTQTVWAGRRCYNYTVVSYGSPGRPLVEHYQVDKIHAWSGGKDDLLFSDAKGPDASLITWNFFQPV